MLGRIIAYNSKKNDKRQETRLGHRHAMYINIPFSTLMYIACLCPNLVSVHFYAIPILHFKFPKFFIYL